MTETYHGFIDTAHDALIIFEACNRGLLPRVQRRFSDRERRTIRSGAVYVWDEEETGMRRWTDGRTWSPSRVHGCFLIYYELEGRRHQFVNRNGSATNSRGAHASPHSGQIEPTPFSSSHESCPPNIMQKEQGLIKKALSLCTNDKRKLHLVCYYSREDVESGCLTSPKNDPRFANLQIYEDMYPEIGSSGRSDRYSGARARPPAAVRPWNPASPDSPALRDSQPAYVRSSMANERRARANRAEVYRYPSYGPYAGPVRHVNAPGSQGQPQSQQQQPVHSFGATGIAHTPSPPQNQHQPSPEAMQARQHLYTPGTSAMSYGHSAPTAATIMPSQHSQGAPTTGFQTPAPTPYSHHSHSYSAGAWVNGQHAGQQQLRPTPSTLTPYVAEHHSPAFFSSTPPSTYQPVWQHSEPPKAYASSTQPSNSRPVAAPLPPGAWNGSTGGLMIQMGHNPSSSRDVVRPQPRELERPPPQYGFSHGQQPRPRPQQQFQSPPQQHAPANMLPSIEKLDTAAGSMPRKKQQLPAVTTLVADNPSSTRMNSEDMRQLASLRLSFH
ncbi:Gluconate transport-inducing protein [Coemansia aciculifera]|uniref:Gluconate transport-inducing protein n=2 Tax=Coemansia TaxID=4863 RepID=A0A9W8L9Q1_9FUNG|nr:Gluconate transport-inducing protein [Coemansia pectinata]KAJ2863747.1 Gluconate transport-inducing protein [Coemansia aciculifera]KAJ2873454.1 Gluconate transport-inducing protein [Coemansia aciculifera]KAJ2886232.1 Gluconate transport-inducing protein [Coemansia aciculifera]